MNEHNREEDRYDRDEPREGSGGAKSGDFPWSDKPGGNQPAQSWENPASAGGSVGAADSGAAPAQVAGQPPGNGLAIAGFVISIVALILCFISVFDLIFIVPAIVFSAIGLSKANKQGRPHRGLAIAGLSISLVALVLMVLLTLLYVGVASRFEEVEHFEAPSGGAPAVIDIAAGT